MKNKKILKPKFLLVSSLIALTQLHTITAQAVELSESDMSRKPVMYQSPGQVTELCVAAAKLPMGNYSQDDVEDESELCSIDFYNNSVALCPKTWSTSPGTIINELDKASSRDSADAESRQCEKGGPLHSVAKFKQTMNQVDTSGTFSLSSILYYHFSRALDAVVNVPVAVYRSMDKAAHYERVTSKAHPSTKAKMNFAGWQHIKEAETKDGYNQALDILTKDRKQIYGVLLNDKGSRYGVEINGTRESGWGKGQNLDFQNTPAYMALRSAKPLDEAITEGYNLAIKNPKIKAGFLARPSKLQMKLWINELAEIAILDHIFSQQDRIGNIDYVWYWVYPSEGGFKYKKVDKKYKDVSLLKKSSIPVPAELKDVSGLELVQKTSIGDNDAGGLRNYANFSKQTNMVGSIRHMRQELYDQIQLLAKDFQVKGENYQVLKKESDDVEAFHDVGGKRFLQMISNTLEVADLLKKNKDSGLLKLNSMTFEASGKTVKAATE